jgi:hypothetical protein
MKNKLLLVVMALVCLLPTITFGQTSPDPNLAANLKKYWENRDRFQKFFVKIGLEPGESIPAAKRNRFDNAHIMRWQDATTHLGYYIGVLATEYKLLKDANQPTQATLNELYFAIEAFNRLDLRGEFHYAGRLKGEFASESLNGWFIRDDVPALFSQNWADLGMHKSFSDFFNPDLPKGKEFGAGSDPSQDQIIALFMGFAFVKKYVDNVFVQPVSGHRGFNVVSEVQDITRRIMGRLQEFKDFKKNEFTNSNHSAWTVRRNYCFGNPVYGWETINKHDRWVFLMAFPIVRLAQTVTGDNSFEEDFKFEYFNGDVHFIFRVPFSKLSALYYNQVWDNDAEVCIDLAQIMIDLLSLHGLQYVDILSLQGLNLPIDFVNPAHVALGIAMLTSVLDLLHEDLTGCWTSPNVNSKMNMRIVFTAVAQSNIQDISQLEEKCTHLLPLPIFPMIAKIYNGLYISDGNRDHWLSTLNEMSACDGSFMYTENNDPNNPLTGHGGQFWSYDNRWLKHSSSFHEFDPGEAIVQAGNYSALDYMLMYNLFHIQFKQSLNLPTYSREVICPCKSAKFTEVSNSVNNSNWNEFTEIILPNTSSLQHFHIVKKYLNDYKDIGLNLERYIMQDLTVIGTGNLQIREDIKACNNAILKVEKFPAPQNTQGKIQVGNTTGAPEDLANVTLRFTAGTQLQIKEGGILEIHDNSRVVIEEGATLKIWPNSTVFLNGSNAVLEIRGNIELMTNGVFKPTGTGHVLFNIPKTNNNPNITVNGNNCQMVFEDATGIRPKKMVIAANTIVFPPANLNLFKIEGVRVELLGATTGIKLGCPFHLVNSDIAGTNSEGITVYHLTQTNYIAGNNFSNHNRALTFTGYSSLFDIKIRYNQFSNCVNSIVLHQQPAHVGGNYFDNSGGILAGGAVASAGPIKAGLYRGPLRVELNRFQNSSAVSVNGSSFPTVNLMGNVCNWTSTSPFGKGWGYGGDRTTSTLTCNYFENQADAVFVSSGGELNLSANRISNIPTVTGGNITGGSNYFKNNQRSIALFSNGSTPTTSVYYYLNNGYNSFDANPALHGSSLNIDRQWNYLGLNHLLDANGNVVLSNNYFTPLLDHSNYSFPPVNTIEKNGYPGYHFKLLEFGANTPFYLVGTMHSPTHTCPVSYWNDAVANPTSFDPMTVGSFGTNKRNQERPFASDGVTTATVPSGIYMGQNMGTAFNNAVGGVSAPATDPEEGAVLRPVPQGLLNLANLLASTASCTDVAGMSIYKDGYSIYLKTLADAYALNVFEGNTTLENNQITAALAVFTAIDAHNLQFQSTQPNRFYETKLNTRIDKVHVYRAFKRFDDALTVVSDLLSFANSTDQASVMFLNCYIENEKQLKNNVINWLEFEEFTTNCGVLYNQSWPTYTDSTGGGDTTQQGGGTSEPYVTYTLTPNPATDIITVDMNINTDGNVKIAVFNKFGIKVVNDIPLGELLAGNHTHTVTIVGLPVDVYNMVVYIDNVPFVKHFIKQSE